MPTRKVSDLPQICCHPEHNPPMHMLYDDGYWEHTCPGCHAVTRFTVQRPTLAAAVKPTNRPRDPGWLRRIVEQAVFDVSCKPPHLVSEEARQHLEKLRQGNNVRRN